ncbi:hypothetical protein [Streptomyces sp. NPDC088739]|uniref:hypothetical protein n=1 Tax=Streptomyces sp. NPDC088739 TaxID=3365882 RepID=UPI00382ED250
MTHGDDLPTIRMRPVEGVGQACRIIPLPGAGHVILEGPADIVAIVRLAPLGIPEQPAAMCVVPDVDDIGPTLDWVRVVVQDRYGTPSGAVRRSSP